MNELIKKNKTVYFKDRTRYDYKESRRREVLKYKDEKL